MRHWEEDCTDLLVFEEFKSLGIIWKSGFGTLIMIPKCLCEEIECMVCQFVNGSSSSGRKVALVSLGGGSKLMTDSKALWVQVLRVKYGVTKKLPKTLSRRRCSFLWRALKKVPSMGPLINMIPGYSNLNLECILSDKFLDYEISSYFRVYPGVTMILLRSHSWARHFVSYGKGLTSLNQFLTSCTNWTGFKVYLNTDGSVKYENGSAAARGIAELWGILDGLGILMDRGYDHVLIQNDNLEAIKAIQDPSISHIPKGDNQEADSLVKLAHGESYGLRIFE
ncbi:hypothetical protein Gotri_005401, partial [Gossypium trilobum]|nr:hypothetical protein [Gossypium trilobum]